MNAGVEPSLAAWMFLMKSQLTIVITPRAHIGFDPSSVLLPQRNLPDRSRGEKNNFVSAAVILPCVILIARVPNQRRLCCRAPRFSRQSRGVVRLIETAHPWESRHRLGQRGFTAPRVLDAVDQINYG